MLFSHKSKPIEAMGNRLRAQEFSCRIDVQPDSQAPIRTRKPRKRWRRFGMFTLLIGFLLALRAVPASELTSAYATPAQTPPASASHIYGFSTSLDTLSPAELNAHLSGMKATGANWVRFDVSWARVQPTSAATFDWSVYDRIFSATKARNMQAVGVIDFTPAWARVSYCTNSKMCPPANPDAYGSFAAAAAARYAPYGVTDWEIWNEPNISYRFHPAANPALYTRMLKSAYTDIKRVEPDDTIIVGGTAPSETDRANLTPFDFIKAIYANGGSGYFDAVAAHPYTYPNSPADNLPDAWGQMTTMHNIMASHGDGNKKIWITEFGAPTNGPNVAGDHVSEAAQAQILSDAIRIFRNYAWSGPFFYYDYQDSGTGTWNSENFYGLIRADGTRKPSYNVWVTAIASNQ